ncbi:serine hydrolase [Hamadaea tsunoensis]|uniref:serine hydrolase n=1 Tax=Hamadaea tsunoensis TaxID=53368 RepID=UPI00041B7BE4|nr:serine hydrolase [Hamadaea tsunoensis]
MEDPTHPRLSRRRLMGLVAGGLTATAVGGVGIFEQRRGDAAGPSAAPSSTAEPVAGTSTKASAVPKQPAVHPVVNPATQSDTWYAWQWVNLTTGAAYGSANARTETNNTESMVKAWLGADYIAGLESAGESLGAADKALITKMIRSSDDAAAQTLWQRRGGDAAIERLIADCGLTNTSVTPDWWSKTQITAYDATKMLRTILNRSQTSPWTAWLVDDLMRSVDPGDAFGIAQVLAELDPQAKPAVKNGWTAHGATGLWNLNCLAEWTPTGSSDRIVLSVLTRYPVAYGQSYGEKLCRDVTRQLCGTLFAA